MKSLKEIISGPAFRLLGYRPQQVSVDAWDREYRSGEWKYLETIGSIAGQVSILGYVQFLKPQSILDVGCGAGLLVVISLLAPCSVRGRSGLPVRAAGPSRGRAPAQWRPRGRRR